jgi:hypothetical protein
MTHSDAEEVCLAVMEEYLPKSVSKKERREMLRTMFYELTSLGALDLDDDASDDEESDETEDLTSLIR